MSLFIACILNLVLTSIMYIYSLLLQLNQPEAAVVAHHKGLKLKEEISGFKGIVKAYLRIPK